jgi:hypothetical protein
VWVVWAKVRRAWRRRRGTGADGLVCCGEVFIVSILGAKACVCDATI